MPAFEQRPSCACPRSLVLVEALPLCRMAASGWPLGVPDDIPLSDEEVETATRPGLPARCAAVMPCADAFALLKEVGHVEW